MNPITYRSIYTGQEIDEAIASMKASVGLIISNDFLGGQDKAASAELAKTLNDHLTVVDTPDHIANLLSQSAGYIAFTDADQAKLDRTNTSFRGVYADLSSLNSATLSEDLSYTGNEIAVIINNGFGFTEIRRWDASKAVWTKAKLFGVGDFDSVTASVAGQVSTFSFNPGNFSTMKCLISVSNNANTQRQIQEILVTYIGGDTYISIYGDVGNASLFNASAGVDGSGNVVLYITTLSDNLTISGKQLALI